MARYQVILAFDGTKFFGFQRQAEIRTVQGELESALRRLNWPGKSILAAGRTDTGVHAEGQVVAFDLDWPHAAIDLQQALNALLPSDIVIRRLLPVRHDFHPRYDATARRYRYQIICQPLRDPFREAYYWRVWPAVNGDLLTAAAALVLGEHDFAAFGRPMKPGGSTVRAVLHSSWSQEAPDRWRYEVEATAFLYRMVRRLVYIQVAVGQGRYPSSLIAHHLAHPENPADLGLAPPHGLFLEEVRFQDVAGSQEANGEVTLVSRRGPPETEGGSTA